MLEFQPLIIPMKLPFCEPTFFIYVSGQITKFGLYEKFIMKTNFLFFFEAAINFIYFLNNKENKF